MACDFQHGEARAIAERAGSADIRLISAELARNSIPVLNVVLGQLLSVPGERTGLIVSGEALLHGCCLVGRSQGKLGVITHIYRVVGGQVVCEAEEYFEDRRKIVCSSGAPLHLLGRSFQFVHDPAIWTDSAEVVVRRILGEVKQASMESGGPDQIVHVDNTGSRWLSSPPVAGMSLNGDLASATITALVSMISPSISGGTIVSPTILVNGGSFTVNIDTTDGLKITGNGITTKLNNGLAMSTNYAAVQATDGSNTCALFPVGLNVWHGGTVKIQLAANPSSGAAGLTLYDNIGQSVSVLPAGISFGGVQVLTARYPTTPSTLADVIAVLRWHGLSN